MSTMVLNMSLKIIGLGMSDLKEIQLARTLGRVIDENLQNGVKLPDEVIQAYLELYKHWQIQIEEGKP